MPASETELPHKPSLRRDDAAGRALPAKGGTTKRGDPRKKRKKGRRNKNEVKQTAAELGSGNEKVSS